MREQGTPQPTRASAEGECRGARRKREPAPSDTDATQLNLLRRQYRSLTGKAVHPSVPRFLLARGVAYERQIRQRGDLPARVACALATAAREELGPPGQAPAGSRQTALRRARPPSARCETGTRSSRPGSPHRAQSRRTGETTRDRAAPLRDRDRTAHTIAARAEL